MWLEGYALVTMIGVLLSFFIACQKNLNVGVYILAGLLVPIAALVAVVHDPARVTA